MKQILNSIKIVFFVMIIGLSLFTYNTVIKRYDTKGKIIKVESGDTPSNIYDKLGIKYQIYDKIYFKITNKDLEIKKGIYEFESNLSKYEIINYIIANVNNQIVLTIPEGFTTDQVLNRIERLGLATRDDMLNAMKDYDFYYKHSDNFEGYIFPDTYFINRGATPKEILDIILSEFLEKFPSTEYDKEKMYEVLKLASIIEKEANKQEDRAKVSAVFHNRINKNMPLQSDATLKYELNRKIFKKDLQGSDSLYNTYKHKGLTPTPISNPSYESIKAAMFPEKDFDYLYFFMYEGKTYYSNTHSEHLQKRKESGHIK